MKVLVTGGAGFLGSHLVERLIERGDEVFVVDDLSTGSLENLRAVRGHARLHLNVDSVLNHPMMNETVKRCDQVVHLAAAVGVRKLMDEPVSTITTNIRGTEITLSCCSRHNVPVFLSSASDIYGKSDELLSEEHDRLLGPTTQRRWAYAATKVLEEFLALAYSDEKGLPVIVGRIFNTVGPRQTGRWGMVLPNFVESAIRGEPIRVFGNGEQLRCFCHVEDTLRAIEGLLGCDEAWGGTYNIGHGAEVSILELAGRVKALAESDSPIETVPLDQAHGASFSDMERRRPDCTRIQELIGWSPRRDLDEIILETIAHTRAEAQA